MERIHFAQYVLNNIRENGAKTATLGLGDGYIWVNSDRTLTEKWGYIDRNDRDDWFLSVETFFGFPVHICIKRSNEAYIKVPKELRKPLLIEWYKLEDGLREKNRLAKEEERARKERAQWWP